MLTENETVVNVFEEIKGVEIFSTGLWNGDKYTDKDLEDMVESFNAIGKTRVKPFLKLGHDNKQKLVQSDGLPAAGSLFRFESTTTVVKKLPAEFLIVTFNTSRASATCSCDVMLYQKVRSGDAALVGIVTD